jgi:hypothetical protein
MEFNLNRELKPKETPSESATRPSSDGNGAALFNPEGEETHRGDIILRADGVTITDVIDVTVRHPKIRPEKAGAAAEQGERDKRKAYDSWYHMAGVHLIPFSVETGGYMGAAALAFLEQLAAAGIYSVKGDFDNNPLFSLRMYQYLGRISVEIVAGTARTIAHFVRLVKEAKGFPNPPDRGMGRGSAKYAKQDRLGTV